MPRKRFTIQRKRGAVRRVAGKTLLRILRRNPRDEFIVAYVPPVPPARERIVRVAASQIGVCERPYGSNSGPRVQEYQASTTVGGTGWPWCQAFVCWVQKEAGITPFYQGAYVPHLEAEARKRGRWHRTPKRGDAVVFNFDSDAEAEHVGIVRGVSADGKTVVCIEGNTAPTASGSQANGGGVYEKRRPISQCKGFVDLVGDRNRAQ